MTARISITRLWSDEHVAELDIETSDGASVFRIQTYVGHDDIPDLVTDLDRFKQQVYGGIYDLEFGKFGPEYAGGAFFTRFHFHPAEHGRLRITIKAESDWHEFSETKVASSAILYLKSEPAQLDRFIDELRGLGVGGNTQATLAALSPDWIK